MAPWIIAFVLTGFQLPFESLVAPPDPRDIWMEALHQCENPNHVEKVWDTNNQWSYGKYQWQMKSWLRYKKQGATKANITDDEMQDKITRYVLDTNGDGDWVNCGRVVRKSLGVYNQDP